MTALHAWSSFVDALTHHPGQITRLLDQSFSVVRPWRDRGALGLRGGRVLDAWPVGTQGIVCEIVFGSSSGWLVRMERVSTWDGLADDEIWIDVPLREFLHATSPLAAAPGASLTSLQAANDAERGPEPLGGGDGPE